MFYIGRYRQYGLWERYADLYPDEDLVYTVGVSDYKKDWFFAQVTRCISFQSSAYLLYHDCINQIIIQIEVIVSCKW